MGKVRANCRPSNTRPKSVALFQGSREPLKVYEEKNGTNPSHSSFTMWPLNLQLFPGLRPRPSPPAQNGDSICPQGPFPSLLCVSGPLSAEAC